MAERRSRQTSGTARGARATPVSRGSTTRAASRASSARTQLDVASTGGTRRTAGATTSRGKNSAGSTARGRASSRGTSSRQNSLLDSEGSYVDLTSSPYDWSLNFMDDFEQDEFGAGSDDREIGRRSGESFDAPIVVDTPRVSRRRGGERKRAALSSYVTRFLDDVNPLFSDDDDSLPDVPPLLEIAKLKTASKASASNGTSSVQPKASTVSASTVSASAVAPQPAQSETICCPICLLSLSEIKQDKLQMMSGTCGHLVCSQCMSSLLADVGAKCPSCRKKLAKKSIHPIFL